MSVHLLVHDASHIAKQTVNDSKPKSGSLEGKEISILVLITYYAEDKTLREHEY